MATAIVAAYIPSLGGDFLWDDDQHITVNPTIIGPLGLTEIWTSTRAYYFPLVLTNFWVQHALWGLDPLGYRIVTLVFHVLKGNWIFRGIGSGRGLSDGSNPSSSVALYWVQLVVKY